MVQAGINGSTKISQIFYVYPVVPDRELGNVRSGATCMKTDVFFFKWSVRCSFKSMYSAYGTIKYVLTLNIIVQVHHRTDH